MKKLLLCLIIIITSQVRAQEAAKQVRQAMDAQVAAWNNADIPAFMEHYWKSDSMKFVSSKKVEYGWKKTFDNYKEHYPTKKAMGTLAFKLIEVSELSDKAVFVVGKWSLEKERPTSGHFTLLWRKINGKWVIVDDHTS